MTQSRRFCLVSPPGLQDLFSLLRSIGYDNQDFLIEHYHTEKLDDLLGLREGVVKVSRRSTGECRMYAMGVDSAWISALLLDLARGRLSGGPKLRRRRFSICRPLQKAT